jgi:hypothetical protein
MCRYTEGGKPMSDGDKVRLAFDLLENADVMQRFQHEVWIEVDREMWEAFNSDKEEAEQ